MDESNFAAERSHRDVQNYYEFAKSLCQTLIVINGVAITALLAYSGSEHKAFQLPLQRVGSAIFIFCFGIIFAVLASLAFLREAHAWGEHWEYASKQQTPGAVKPSTTAMAWRRGTLCFIVLSLIFFISGSVWLGCSLVAG
jgi:hypothetical protein